MAFSPSDFNSYGARRGNDRVMTRGTFANIRIRNYLAPWHRRGVTRHLPDGQVMSIYDAAMKYQVDKVPLLVLAGSEYGTGSNCRDWAAIRGRTFSLGVAGGAGRQPRTHPLQQPGGEWACCRSSSAEGETWQLAGPQWRRDSHDQRNGRKLAAGELKLTVSAEPPMARPRNSRARLASTRQVELDYYRDGGVPADRAAQKLL